MKRFIRVIALTALLAVVLCACGKKARPLKEVYDEIIENYRVADFLEIAKDTDLKTFYGVDAADVKEFAGGFNSTGVSQEEIIFIQAVDADAAQRVADHLEQHRQSKLDQMKNYNPEQYAIIEKSSVDTDKNYVSLIISPKASEMKADYQKGIGVK